ncbi:hypothetical protein COY27_02415 [Candidatus Woesearchaeota archaeon CG_4_10_14_0_2_um_filter_33_13]|nr:MAG: hypothetical protein COY27_02415 [Candidatus Woesearchaeota archaeon CG_4_10_14_0_2_um_filter_33_13]
MVTISHLVKRIINNKPLLYEALSKDIINYPNLAEHIKDELEAELGSKVKGPAVVMALRRFRETIKKKEDVKVPLKFNSQIIMKSGLCDVTFVRSPELLRKLKSVYDLINYDTGETLNVIYGNYEITIVAEEKHLKEIITLLKNEKKINLEHNLVSLAMSFSKEFLYTPGILATVIRELFWENINIYENISTMTEVIFIVHKMDAVRAYNCLQRLIDKR